MFSRLAAWFDSLGQPSPLPPCQHDKDHFEKLEDEKSTDVDHHLKPDAAALMRRLAAFHKTCTFLKQQVNDDIMCDVRF